MWPHKIRSPLLHFNSSLETKWLVIREGLWRQTPGAARAEPGISGQGFPSLVCVFLSSFNRSLYSHGLQPAPHSYPNTGLSSSKLREPDQSRKKLQKEQSRDSARKKLQSLRKKAWALYIIYSLDLWWKVYLLDRHIHKGQGCNLPCLPGPLPTPAQLQKILNRPTPLGAHRAPSLLQACHDLTKL